MKNSLYIYQNGQLSRKDNTLRFTNEDGEKKDIPINSISEIYFFGEETINSDIKRRHTKFIICYFRSKPKNGIMPKVDNAFGFSGYRYIDYELKNSNGILLDLIIY